MKNLKEIISKVPFITDGGLETTLIFKHGIDLPHFASFCLLDKPKYQEIIQQYYHNYLDIARKYKTGFILEAATWRANSDWGYKLGYSDQDLVSINQLAIQQLKSIRSAYQSQVKPILISGCIGPRSDGYTIQDKMNEQEASEYHDHQIKTFKESGVDLVTALTINYLEEGIGIVRSALKHGLPVVLSFTVETDGRLPSRQSLKQVIEYIDNKTNAYPIYYMLNCAHPSHFADQLEAESTWTNRISGIRANASCKSHAELDEATELDAGDQAELANWYNNLRKKLPELRVFGGCCGTDENHIEAITERVLVQNPIVE